VSDKEVNSEQTELRGDANHATRTYSMRELGRWFWDLAGRHDLSLGSALQCAWPLDEEDQPVAVEGDVPVEQELWAGMAEAAIEDGWSAHDLLSAFADGLDPVPR
jgi:hypothetical protein